MKQLSRLTTTVAIAFALGGCASGVTRMDSANAAAATTASAPIEHKVKSVNLWLDDGAKQLVSDNLKFSPDTLRSTIERALTAQGLEQAESAQMLDIEITNFRTRSNFSAVAFGFLAGSDSIEGIVTIKDAAGNAVKRGKVNASYALGGLAGGQDDARMSWLYEEFAKLAAAEVSGVPVKK